MTTFELTGLDAITNLLSPASIASLKRAILVGAGEVVKGYVATYPGPVSKPIKWSSEKQRRWFWWAVGRGLVEVPYRRMASASSQRLGASWAVSIASDNEGEVGSRATYARWVQGADYQTAQHKATGWVTDQEAIERAVSGNDIDEVFSQAVSGWIGG